MKIALLANPISLQADGGYWHIIMHSISAKRIPVASEHFLELPVL
jgi:hypothetical protein